MTNNVINSIPVGGSSIFEFHVSVSSCLGSQLPKPEVKDLMHLQVIDWYTLGQELELTSYELRIIKRNHPGDTKSQTCEMFELWLRTQPDASYEQLIKALHKIGHETVAISLCNKCGKYDNFTVSIN